MDATNEMPVIETRPVVMKSQEREIQILLVDDDPGIRQVLLQLLTEENYLVLTADSGAEALEMVETLKIDLIILDLKLPTNDGMDALAEIILKHPTLPIILISAHAHQFLPALALSAGALLDRPLDFVELFHTIRQLLAESHETRLARLTQEAGTFHYIPGKNNEVGVETRFKG